MKLWRASSIRIRTRHNAKTQKVGLKTVGAGCKQSAFGLLEMFKKKLFSSLLCYLSFS